jgi:glycosyltransferase involved in cell wall biosynthesis
MDSQCQKKVRIVLLHTRLSGYLAACLREFKRRSGAELLIYAWPNQDSAPFDPAAFADLGEIRNRRECADDQIEAAVRKFAPDAILVSGWADKGYVKICKEMRNLGVPVISGCDTQWKGNLRQHLAGMTARFHVQKAIDVLWVTGERQATLARALGYHGDRLWDGYYACDWERFACGSQGTGDGGRRKEVRSQRSEDEGQTAGSAPHAHRRSQSDATGLPHSASNNQYSESFLYVGRYVPEKGIDTLAAAYAAYCKRVEKPWKLVCAGAGPLRETLMAAGAEDRGFVQPLDLPALMHSATAFVLPSRFEPWGVVVQEAAASGLPLILSDACGAGAHLLRHLYNGFSFPSGSVDGLVRAMRAMHGATQDDRKNFGLASFELSKQYTPQLWAARLLAGLSTLTQKS